MNRRQYLLFAAAVGLAAFGLSLVFTYLPDWLVATIVIAMSLTGVLGVALTIYAHCPYRIQIRTINQNHALGEWSTIKRYRNAHKAVTDFKRHHEGFIIPGFAEYRIINNDTGRVIDVSKSIPTVGVGWGNMGKHGWILPQEEW